MASYLIRTGLSVALALSGVVAGHCAAQSPNTIPETERNVLITLYQSAGGERWANSSNWCDNLCSADPKFNSPGTECTWFGVTGDGSGGHVTRIVLSGNNLTGEMPDLKALTELVFFDASNNRLFGAIPPLSGSQKLATFDVGQNQLSGPLPPLNELPSLKFFVVADNRLGGPVPDLSALASLVALDIGGNRFTGRAPVPPSPNALHPGSSSLCPNYLSESADTFDNTNSTWDLATGNTPWTERCNVDAVFLNDFES